MYLLEDYKKVLLERPDILNVQPAQEKENEELPKNP